jgi:NADH-quinone oxidoreductase subunit C
VLAKQQISLNEALMREFPNELFALPPHSWKEYGLTFGLKQKDALKVFRKLCDDNRFLFNMLIDITCVDWLDRREPRFDIVYQLLSLSFYHRLCIKIHVDEDNPEVDSVRTIWQAANFLEREVWDMYGIKFNGHGDLRRILMYDEFVGHPLRKDYPLRGKQPRIPLRVPELRNTSGDMFREELVSLPVRQRMKENAEKSER